jgi:signal transduction histidine kinase
LNDIIADKEQKTYGLLSLLLEESVDELTTLVAEETGQEPLAERIRKHIEGLFGPKKIVPEEINLARWVKKRLEQLQPLFAHRTLEIVSSFSEVPPIMISPEVLQKVVDGLIRNAVENTPDEGKILLSVSRKGNGALFEVHDYGVGIPEEAQRRIFEGFFPAQDTMNYSTKRPYDFNAGGKGADLLRMKILSERHGFRISMVSARCGVIPKESDLCPGRISSCSFCTQKDDCFRSGETIFTVTFPAKYEGPSKN